MRKNVRKIISNSDEILKKSNEISMAKLNRGLTLNQMQLFAFAIFSTQKNGVTEFQKHEFEKKFGVEKYATIDARRDSIKLLDLKMSTEDLENDYFEYWNVFIKMGYKHGQFTFKWSDEMLPHILELKEKYISTDLKITSRFKSSFSWILYDYLKAHYGYWYKNITKKALLNLFDIENVKTYQLNTNNFKQKVLDVAVKEINMFTEFQVTYKEKKNGRKITDFEIRWSIGEKIEGATKKQIDDLSRIIEVVFDDMFKYINLDDSFSREKAIEMIRELESMQIVLSDTVGITKQYADELLNKANKYLGELEFMFAQNQQNKNNKNELEKPFYNWLDDK